MARIWSTGLELNNIDIELGGNFSDGQVSVSSDIKRSGNYSQKCLLDATHKYAYSEHQFSAPTLKSVLFVRFYLYIHEDISGDNYDEIFKLIGMGYGNIASFRMNTDRTLELWATDKSEKIGNNSFALNKNTWYRIEIGYDGSTPATTSLTAKIDGSVFANGIIDYNYIPGADEFLIGIGWDNENLITGELYFDDIAINDNSGDFQNSWPGAGKIIHLRPNGKQLYSQLLKSDGSAGDANNYQEVDEVTPDDAVTYLKGKITNAIDNYAMPDLPNEVWKVTVLSLGARFRGEGSSDNSSFQFILGISGDVNSVEFTPTSAVWVTNAINIPRLYPVTAYEWDLDQPFNRYELFAGNYGLKAQIKTGNTNYADVSTVWLLLEYEETPYLLPDSKMPSGYHCFISQFVKNLYAGFIPLKTPDGVNRCW